MGNKNKHVIIGYFLNQEAATESVQQLKDWDNANDDIKLGGMGVLTWDKGKLNSARLAITRAARAQSQTDPGPQAQPASSPAV